MRRSTRSSRSRRPASRRSSPPSPPAAPARSDAGCGPWPPTPTRSAAAPAWARSACASPAASPSAMMVDERMLAPVLSQPSLPSSPHQEGQAGPRDLRRRPGPGQGTVRNRGHLRAGAALHRRPSVSPAERFQRLREELGDNFIAVEIDSSPGNPYGHPKMAHSVLTEHLEDQPGHADPGRPRPGAPALPGQAPPGLSPTPPRALLLFEVVAQALAADAGGAAWPASSTRSGGSARG